MITNLVEDILDASKTITEDYISRHGNKPSPFSRLAFLMEEVGELSTEVNIREGFLKHKEIGSDGIVGEGIDVIIDTLDLISQYYPDITHEQLWDVATLKLKKWFLKKSLVRSLSYVGHK